MDPSNSVGVKLDTHITKERFKGRVGIVTGGASGIGRATVERFANDGAVVHFFDIDDEKGKALEFSLRSTGYNVTYHRVDVSDKASCEEAVGKIAAENGGEVHMLFNNAASFVSKGEFQSLQHLLPTLNSLMTLNLFLPVYRTTCICSPSVALVQVIQGRVRRCKEKSFSFFTFQAWM